jgi:hypothetical protein
MRDVSFGFLCSDRGGPSYAVGWRDFILPPPTPWGRNMGELNARQWGWSGVSKRHHSDILAKLLKEMVDAVGIEPTTPPV